jgi:hypothetical protein
MNVFLKMNSSIARGNAENINEFTCKIYKGKKTLICNQDQDLKPLKRHLQTEKHKKRVDLSKMKDAYFRDTNKFEIKLLKMLLKINVPLSILVSESFIEEFAFMKLSSRSTFMKTILPAIYQEEMSKVKNDSKNVPFYLIADEIPDFMGRKIVNILSGKLILTIILNQFCSSR